MKKLIKKIMEAIQSRPHVSRSQEWSMFRDSEDYRI